MYCIGYFNFRFFPRFWSNDVATINNKLLDFLKGNLYWPEVYIIQISGLEDIRVINTITANNFPFLEIKFNFPIITYNKKCFYVKGIYINQDLFKESQIIFNNTLGSIREFSEWYKLYLNVFQKKLSKDDYKKLFNDLEIKINVKFRSKYYLKKKYLKETYARMIQKI